MKVQLFISVLLLPLLFAGCLSNNLVSSQEKQTANDSAQSNTSVAANIKAAKNNVIGNSAVQTVQKPQQSTQALSNEDLMSALPGLLGNDFFLIESYKPSYLIGDFNGDGYSDAAMVVGAQDRYGKPGELVNPVENLCYLSVDVSFQNIINGSFVSAHPKQNCGEIEKKKLVLEPKESQYGLFVAFGDAKGLQNVTRRGDAFGQKFLLLDAVYQNESVETVVADAKDSFTAKIKKCVPTNIKGDLIASVNSDGGTLAIYFDGTKFKYKQCGD